MFWFMFDYLPVEMLHAIFEYLWTNEILNSLLSINDYLNSVILNYNESFINFNSILRPLFDLTCDHLRPDQVIKLVLSDSNDTPDQSQLFLSRFPIEQFINLRAITLIEIDDDAQSILTNLDKMKYLTCIEINPKFHYTHLNIKPQLTRFIVKYNDVIYFENQTFIIQNQLLRLRHLSLTYCSYFQLELIFRYAPMLVSLNISIIFATHNGVNSFADCNKERPPLNLTNLTLSIDISIDCIHADPIISRVHLERFLSHMPRLRRLELIVNCEGNSNLAYGDRWKIFIVERLPLLRIFNFKFHLEHIYYDKQTILSHFRNSFWLDKNRNWFVAYNPRRSLLFTVPYFAPRSILYSETPVLHNLTTLPIEQYSIFYNMINELTFDSINEELSYRYTNVDKLILSNHKITKALIDLSRIRCLCVNLSSCSFNTIIQLIRRFMPNLNQLSFDSKLSLICSTPIIPLEQIRILHMPFFAYSLTDDDCNWSRIFLCVERLSMTVNSCHEMALLIDRFENMSCASFNINNCCINGRRNLRERRVTRQWIIENTRRLGTMNNNNFTCRFEDTNIFTVHLWIGNNTQQQIKVCYCSTFYS
ncbi:unnamed protein product [Adineta steineri]|uniref:F-box domain-containing protein n=2 Tax=Adineta steineri TaxID=433720 RepID=A0A819TAT3_9BILA|nr:unnamed protein product [Adineta steineri]CAF4076671.1 unnamed protein product [Adineta steineri]